MTGFMNASKIRLFSNDYSFFDLIKLGSVITCHFIIEIRIRLYVIAKELTIIIQFR